MKVDEKVIKEVERLVGGLMADHDERIKKAFDLNDGELEVAFKVKMGEDLKAGLLIGVDISYLPVPKVKDTATGGVANMPLFDAAESANTVPYVLNSARS